MCYCIHMKNTLKSAPIFTPKHIHADVLGARVLGIKAETTDDMIYKIGQGFPVEVIENVAEKLFFTGEMSTQFQVRKIHSPWGIGLKFAELIGISSSTYQRRKLAQKLTPAESEGVYRYAALHEKTIEVFGNEEKARIWLNNPVKALGDCIPLEYARTEPGARLVMQVLGRLEHGSYS